MYPFVEGRDLAFRQSRPTEPVQTPKTASTHGAANCDARLCGAMPSRTPAHCACTESGGLSRLSLSSTVGPRNWTPTLRPTFVTEGSADPVPLSQTPVARCGVWACRHRFRCRWQRSAIQHLGRNGSETSARPRLFGRA